MQAMKKTGVKNPRLLPVANKTTGKKEDFFEYYTDEIKEKAKELASGVSRVVGEDSTVVEQLVEAMHTCKMMREQVLKEADSLCSSDDDAF